MVTYIFYNQGTDAVQKATQLGTELEARKVAFELVDADSIRGIGLLQQYDIMARPAVVLAAPNGSPIQVWDQFWPTAADIAYQYFV